ncbi:hypothetical protein AVEN_16187-1 [Araneus ventricosus]|uniref:Uncharacterized protein n=1 Tax=Araneus ventricosus TaxID=182803 RepID=A0A4Y2IWS8_ARAVE|nr:hypothetical protein AVEN_16187-1 [Araneus ventricosus]
MDQHPGVRALQILLRLIIFVWGYIKDRVFATPIADVDELKARIQAAVCIVTEVMLKNSWRELEYRLDILRATNERLQLKFTEFYTPHREIECKIAIAQTNPKNHAHSHPARSLPFPPNCGDPTRTRTPLDSLLSSLPSIGVKRNVTQVRDNRYLDPRTTTNSSLQYLETRNFGRFHSGKGWQEMNKTSGFPEFFH